MYKNRKQRSKAARKCTVDIKKQEECRNSGNSDAAKPQNTETKKIENMPKTLDHLNRYEMSPSTSKENSNIQSSKLSSERATTKKRKQEVNQDSVNPPKRQISFMPKKMDPPASHQQEKEFCTLSIKLKAMLEELHSGNIETPKRLLLLDQACNLVKGHAVKLVFAHDTVKVIECLISLGNENQRTMLFEELKGSIILLSKSEYAKFSLLKMLEHGTQEQKDFILQQFNGNILQLICHSEASSVIDIAFNEHCDSLQRKNLTQEFYGPFFKFFKDEDSFNIVFSSERKNSMEHVLKVLGNVIKKPAARKNALVHHILRDFMENADRKYRFPLIKQLNEYVIEILHSEDGSKIALYCVWYGTAKERSIMIKSFEGHVAKIAQEEFGHMVLLAIFDCVDDTKSIEECIIKELYLEAKTVCRNKIGIKVLTYLISPRNTNFISTIELHMLRFGDYNAICERAQPIRRSEIHQAATPVLIKIIAENLPDNWTNDTFCEFATLALNNAQVDCRDAFLCIADLAVDRKCFSSNSKTAKHFIENPSSNMLMKSLIRSNKKQMSKGLDTFAACLIDRIPVGRLSSWMNCNLGCFLIVDLLDSKDKRIVRRVSKEIVLCEQLLNVLRTTKMSEGASILLSKKLSRNWS